MAWVGAVPAELAWAEKVRLGQAWVWESPGREQEQVGVFREAHWVESAAWLARAAGLAESEEPVALVQRPVLPPTGYE